MKTSANQPQPAAFEPAPNTLAACQAMIAAQQAELNSQRALVEQLTVAVGEQQQKIDEQHKAYLELDLAYTELLRRAFEKRSERYLKNPLQLALDFGGDDAAQDAAEGLSEAILEFNLLDIKVEEHTRKGRPKKKRNEKLPEHLPRYDAPPLEVPDNLKYCETHGERTIIGYDILETLEFERPKLRVRVTSIPKLACSDDSSCGVKSLERPTGLVEGDKYDSSIGAEIITAKYGYHLPIYRQQDYFAGSGWMPGRSTLLNILAASAFVVRPLVDHVAKIVLRDLTIGTDDTRVTLLIPKDIPAAIEGDAKSQRIHDVFTEARAEGKPSVSGRMWAYRSESVKLQVFDFTVSRHRDGPDIMLANYAGTVLADCYSGYQGLKLRSGGSITRAACNSHARRKVFDARETYPLEASILLGKYQQLYDIEDRARPLSADERLLLRQSESQLVWDSLREWLDGEQARKVLPKSKMGEAIRYLNNQWEALGQFLKDGRVPIDNNDVEQLMKQIAVGRKNWLFIGSVAAGERAADFMTLLSSALRNDLDVWCYIKDVLDQLLSGSTDYESLRPDVWAQSHPEAIREYRQLERRDRADRKQRRRESRRGTAAE